MPQTEHFKCFVFFFSQPFVIIEVQTSTLYGRGGTLTCDKQWQLAAVQKGSWITQYRNVFIIIPPFGISVLGNIHGHASSSGALVCYDFEIQACVSYLERLMAGTVGRLYPQTTAAAVCFLLIQIWMKPLPIPPSLPIRVNHYSKRFQEYMTLYVHMSISHWLKFGRVGYVLSPVQWQIQKGFVEPPLPTQSFWGIVTFSQLATCNCLPDRVLQDLIAIRWESIYIDWEGWWLYVGPG